MAAAATETIAPLNNTFMNIKASGNEKRSIETDLNYWKPVENQRVEADFTSPEAAKVHEELAKLIETHKVLIHDIRGEESNYTLDTNGFQYVQHDVPELDDWSDEQKVTKVLIPATEKLVADV